MQTLLLNRDQVTHLIDMRQVIGAVEDAYKAFSSNQVEQPDYLSIHLPGGRGEIDFKLGYHKQAELISMKAHSGGFKDNPQAHGVPNSMGTILLFDARSGALACIMDGSLITGLRTGASGAVSVKALARKNARSITAIGTGNQARMQIRAISQVMEIEEIHAWSRTPETLSAFQKDIEREFDISVRIAASKKDAVEKADILITTTRGKGDLVQADWVKPGTHVVAIGTDQRGKQELDPNCSETRKSWSIPFRNVRRRVKPITPSPITSSPWNPFTPKSDRSCWARSQVGQAMTKSSSSIPPAWPSRTTPRPGPSTATLSPKMLAHSSLLSSDDHENLPHDTGHT